MLARKCSELHGVWSPKSLTGYKISIVRPILLYGVLVWHKALEKNVTLKKFQSLQRHMGIRITVALRTTSAESIDALLHLGPIDIFAKGEAYKAFLRIKESSCFKYRNFGHSNIANVNKTNSENVFYFLFH